MQVRKFIFKDSHAEGIFDKEDKFSGFGRIYDNVGSYEGPFQNGRASGYGRGIRPNGEYYIGFWHKHNGRHGQGNHFHLDGSVQEGLF